MVSVQAAIEVRAIGQQARSSDEVTLRDVSLTIGHGELIAIIGGSGSGKTTLLDAMSGLRPPSSGTVTRSTIGPVRAGRYVGYIPNADTILPMLPLDRALRYTAALRGALSDRAAHGRVHVVSGFVEGDEPRTKDALAVLSAATGAPPSAAAVLVVAGADDMTTWKSLRNVPGVHLIASGQLNTYDVLVSDHVVFTEAALAAFVARSGAGPAPKSESGSTEPEDAS